MPKAMPNDVPPFNFLGFVAAKRLHQRHHPQSEDVHVFPERLQPLGRVFRKECGKGSWLPIFQINRGPVL